MKVKFISTVYDNPLPQLCSKQATFPFAVETEDGKIIVSYVIGQAFESVDGATYLSESTDGGKTWSAPVRVIKKNREKVTFSESMKISRDGNELICFGYGYYRADESLPIGNPATGGLLDDSVIITRSTDGGKTWSKYKKIPTHWSNSTEASAPLYVLKNGDWATPITGFPDWSGEMKSRLCGRLLISKDKGKTWNDDAVDMSFKGDKVTCYEQRMCELDSGKLVVIGWNEDTATGERLNNHYAVSNDGGKTFGETTDTSYRAQASSVCAIGGEKLLALHAKRRDTDRPGIYGCIVDLSDGKWNIEEETLLWEPSTPMVKDKHMAEIFSFLKFGQPGAIKLKNGNMFMTFWYAENGQYKVMAAEIEL